MKIMKRKAYIVVFKSGVPPTPHKLDYAYPIYEKKKWAEKERASHATEHKSKVLPCEVIYKV